MISFKNIKRSILKSNNSFTECQTKENVRFLIMGLKKYKVRVFSAR